MKIAGAVRPDSDKSAVEHVLFHNMCSSCVNGRVIGLVKPIIATHNRV